MTLEETLTYLQTKLKEASIPIFYSDEILDKDLLICDRELMPTDAVLEFIRNIKASFVVVAILPFSIEEGVTMDNCDEDFDRKRYVELKKELEPLNDTIYYIGLYVVRDKSTLCFPFTHEKVEEIEEFNELEIELLDQQEPPEEFDEDGNQIIPYKKLSKKDVQEYAEKILADPEYLRIATIGKRQHYLYDFFGSELDSTNCYEVHERAELLFDKHIRSKVQELKSTGMKKVDVMSELGISKGRIDKYY